MNIRVYKIVFSDGRVNFGSREKDSRGESGTNSIASVARSVKWKVKNALKEKDLQQVTIDFVPFHEIDCPKGLAVRRNLPLTEEEKDLFWTEFNKAD